MLVAKVKKVGRVLITEGVTVAPSGSLIKVVRSKIYVYPTVTIWSDIAEIEGAVLTNVRSNENG